jgi:hypothetical protein
VLIPFRLLDPLLAAVGEDLGFLVQDQQALGLGRGAWRRVMQAWNRLGKN